MMLEVFIFLQQKVTHLNKSTQILLKLKYLIFQFNIFLIKLLIKNYI